MSMETGYNDLKRLIRSGAVHERKIDIRSYPLDDGRLIVEGCLKDDRLIATYHWNGEKRPAGVIHDMCVRLLVGGWPVTILDAEAEMRNVPHELCPTTLDSIKRIIGISITSGFSSRIRKRLGGVRGCTHLTHLVLTLGPTALHGYWVMNSRQPASAPRSIEELEALPALINSCALWKEDGPLVRQLQETIERSNGRLANFNKQTSPVK